MAAVPSRRRAPGRAGFTLLELLTASAGLIVVLGLVVSLARYVRQNASLSAMREQMLALNAALAAKGPPPGLPMFAEGMTAENEARSPEGMRALARQNAEAWSAHFGLSATASFDPWGLPVVLINGAHPNLGMAPRFKPFFLSAGPDNRYFTLVDDLYSYDLAADSPHSPPASGGHGE